MAVASSHSHPHEVPLLRGRQREHHRQRAREQNERRHRRVRDVEDIRGERSLGAGVAIEHVRRDERAEQQAFRGQEQPHRELGVRQAGGGLVLVVPLSFALALAVAFALLCGRGRQQHPHCGQNDQRTSHTAVIVSAAGFAGNSRK